MKRDVTVRDGGSTKVARLEEVLITSELQRRKYRAPNLTEENKALHALAVEMGNCSEESPGRVVMMAMNLCSADSAGISVLENGEGKEPQLRFIEVAGKLATMKGGTGKFTGTPSGATLESKTPQLFYYPTRYFHYNFGEIPPTVELLVVPFYSAGGAPWGTIWIASHTEQDGFDAEDLRVMKSLAAFASGMLRVLGFQRPKPIC
jgi:hypothetical protein